MSCTITRVKWAQYLEQYKHTVWNNLLYWMALEINSQGSTHQNIYRKDKPGTKIIFFSFFPKYDT